MSERFSGIISKIRTHIIRTDMKGTEQFKEIIKNYLDKRAKEDELFRAKYETTERTIDDVVTYIFNEVKQSGCCGFADEEIYSMAVHAIDEPTLEIGKPINCDVVVNHTLCQS